MALDSSTAGYLAPATASDYDAQLDRVLHDVIVGVTGISGDLVRPRWQSEPPQQPAFSSDWCAFGVVRTSSDTFAHEQQEGDLGPTLVTKDELLYVLHSFYGPNSSALCARFKIGLEVSQNRDDLRAAGIALVEVQETVSLPALLKEKWVKRIDVTVLYRRRVFAKYSVRTIVSSDLGLNNEVYVTPIVVEPTP